MYCCCGGTRPGRAAAFPLSLILTLLLLLGAGAGCAPRPGGEAAAAAGSPAAPAAVTPGLAADTEKVIQDVRNNPSLPESSKQRYVEALKQSGPQGGAPPPPRP